jgi:hypothetical protein
MTILEDLNAMTDPQDTEERQRQEALAAAAEATAEMKVKEARAITAQIARDKEETQKKKEEEDEAHAKAQAAELKRAQEVEEAKEKAIKDLSTPTTMQPPTEPQASATVTALDPDDGRHLDDEFSAVADL